MRLGSKLVQRLYIPSSLLDYNRAVLGQLRIPHGEHVIRVRVFVSFFEEIVFLFQHFIVARKRDKVRFLLLRESDVEKLPSFGGSLFDEFHLIGREEHYSEDADEFGGAF